MRRFARSVLLAALVVALPAHAEWVRDEVRINVRTGPGTKFRIVQAVASGERVRRLSESENGWIEIRLADGTEGWVPDGYLVRQPPASVRLPRLEQQLEAANGKIEELAKQLEQQTSAIVELETLRRRNETLEVENVQVAGSDRWKSMGMGAAIVLIGMMIGMLAPRGAQGRGRRLRL